MVGAAANRAARQVGSTVVFGGATGIGYGGLIATDHHNIRPEVARSVSLGMAQQMLIPAEGMFGPNVPQLTPFGSSFLRSVAAELRHHAARVVCLGYTAAPGDWLHNTPFSLALSRERAQVACRFLRGRRVSATYGTEAPGKVDPLVPNTTPANLARNRRVEFRVTSGLQLKG